MKKLILFFMFISSSVFAYTNMYERLYWNPISLAEYGVSYIEGSKSEDEYWLNHQPLNKIIGIEVTWFRMVNKQVITNGFEYIEMSPETPNTYTIIGLEPNIDYGFARRFIYSIGEHEFSWTVCGNRYNEGSWDMTLELFNTNVFAMIFSNVFAPYGVKVLNEQY